MGSLRNFHEPTRTARSVHYSNHDSPVITIVVTERDGLTFSLTHDEKSDKEISIYLSLKSRETGSGKVSLSEIQRYRLKSVFTKQEVRALMNEWIVRLISSDESWDSVIFFPDGWVVQK